MKKKICAWCGKEFDPLYNQQKYCGDSCRKYAYNEKQREYARVRVKTKPKKIYTEPIKCVGCGIEFIPHTGHQIYCTSWCRTQCQRKIHQPTSKEKVCEICGKVFTQISPNQKYCSEECAKKVRYEYQSKPAENVSKTNEKLSGAKKRWAKMSWEELNKELIYYGITYKDAQLMAKNNTLPIDFGLKRKKSVLTTL